MLSKLIEVVSGKDDLERIAFKDDLSALNRYLKTRRVLIPRRPKRFLEVSGLTQDQLLEMIQKESEDLAGVEFDPWVLEADGKRRLPAFSSQKKLEVFSKKISQEMNKVFALGSAEVLIDDIKKGLDLDFIDLNLFSENSWEIGLK
ncbi:MAG: hypothetical protein AABZ15_07225 [Nitrospirota bacterium]